MPSASFLLNARSRERDAVSNSDGEGETVLAF